MLTLSTADLDAWLASFLYPFFRFAALAQTAPIVSHPSVPRRVRIGLALLLTIVVAPLVAKGPIASPFSAQGVLLIGQQVAVGVALGIVMQFAFAAVTLAGDMIGLTMGLSFASLVDPQHSEQVPLIGAFLSVVLMLVFMAMNGHLMAISALVDSFNAFPVRADPAMHFDWQRLATGASIVFSAGLTLALPVIAALTVANLALGVLTRTAPQLNLFAVGFPITLAVGLVMLLLALPQAMPTLQSVIERTMLMVAR